MKSLLFCFLLFISACSPNIKCTQEPSTTVLSFLKWYSVNLKSVGNINMVNNNGNTIVDSTKLYSVNFDSTEKYLSVSKKSGFISDKYINQWREHFKQVDEDFKTNPQYDGPPEAFDFDLVMCSQEYDDDLKNIDKATIINQQKENNACVLTLKFLSGMKLEYHLTNNNNKWEIDEIKNVTNP